MACNLSRTVVVTSDQLCAADAKLLQRNNVTSPIDCINDSRRFHMPPRSSSNHAKPLNERSLTNNYTVRASRLSPNRIAVSEAGVWATPWCTIPLAPPIFFNTCTAPVQTPHIEALKAEAHLCIYGSRLHASQTLTFMSYLHYRPEVWMHVYMQCRLMTFVWPKRPWNGETIVRSRFKYFTSDNVLC